MKKDRTDHEKAIDDEYERLCHQSQSLIGQPGREEAKRRVEEFAVKHFPLVAQHRLRTKRE